MNKIKYILVDKAQLTMSHATYEAKICALGIPPYCDADRCQKITKSEISVIPADQRINNPPSMVV